MYSMFAHTNLTTYMKCVTKLKYVLIKLSINVWHSCQCVQVQRTDHGTCEIRPISIDRIYAQRAGDAA